MPDITQMLRIEDIATRLNVSQKTIRRHIHSGKLVSNKIGGVHRISESDLQRFLSSAKYKANEKPRTANSLSKSIKTDQINWVDISDEWDSPLRNEYTSADLFCGAGGMTKGFGMAGYTQVCGLDWFKEAGMTYRHNFDHPLIEGDITSKDIKEKFISYCKKRSEWKIANSTFWRLSLSGF